MLIKYNDVYIYLLLPQKEDINLHDLSLSQQSLNFAEKVHIFFNEIRLLNT